MRQVFRAERIAHIACAVALGLGAPLPVLAALPVADLGTVGPVYLIAEPHFLRDIEARLSRAARDGSLERMQTAARERALAGLLDPPPVAGISAARAPRTHWYDPTVAFESPVIDAEGNLLVAAGERRNPFDFVTYTKTLIFFDARDAAQVAFARERMDAAPERFKPILTGGSALSLTRAWKRRVYADQDGRLARQLGIAEVPALVYQDGRRFRIDTVPAVRE